MEARVTIMRSRAFSVVASGPSKILAKAFHLAPSQIFFERQVDFFLCKPLVNRFFIHLLLLSCQSGHLF